MTDNNHSHDPFRRHSAVKQLTPEVSEQVDGIKAKAEELYYMIDALENSRETALARTKLEEVIMWVVKGITS